MKKLIVFFTLMIFSFGAMSMGSPHENYIEQRMKSNIVRKVNPAEKVLIKNVAKVSVQSSELKNSLSFVGMIVNYVVKLFFYEVISDKALIINELKQSHPQLEAIKNENEIVIC